MVALRMKSLHNRNNSLIQHYELLIFIFLLFEFLCLTFNGVLDSNTRTAYLLTYEFGFNPQSLIGSIISLFTEITTVKMIYVISVISFFALIVQISFLLGTLIRTTQPELKSSVIILTVLFLTSPLSVTYLLGMNTGRFDVYWIFFTLLALVFLKRPVLRWTVPLLCAVAISIHQGYMTTYMPALAIPMLYEVCKTKFSKTSAAVFSLSCAGMISLFMYFQFFPAGFPFKNAVDFAEHLSTKADFIASVPMLHVGFFAPLKESLFEYVLPLTATYSLPVGIEFFIFSLPLLFIFAFIWKNAIKHTKSKFVKFIFLLCAAAPLAFIPSAFVANDWDRYWAAVINNQFILIFYFIYAQEKAVVVYLKKLGDFFERHILLFIAIILFSNSLTFSESTTDIFSFIKDRDAVKNLLETYFSNII